ncbi:hypothetical protein [Halomicrobium salinisoli]|uniref:hypothetical protein n=1 Tax=Halomicrobium salinisoli TaxID=2878391 RepID=UPI001CF0D065|nr:hypothetical protein [Halomicrobium salinisoli]
MTTMKEGPGDDPFADDDDVEESEEQSDTEPVQDPDPEPELDPEPEPEETQDDEQGSETSTTMSTSEIPYVVRRQTVKEERQNEHVAFLRDEYAELEGEILDGVADELDMRSKEVSVTDLREAFVELGDRHQGELAEILEEWGYEHLK